MSYRPIIAKRTDWIDRPPCTVKQMLRQERA